MNESFVPAFHVCLMYLFNGWDLILSSPETLEMDTTMTLDQLKQKIPAALLSFNAYGKNSEGEIMKPLVRAWLDTSLPAYPSLDFTATVND